MQVMPSEQEINFLKRDNPVNLGLSTSDIRVTRQTLQKLKQHPSYPPGYDVALKQVLDEQDRVASFREIEHQLKTGQILVTRGNFTKSMVKLAGLSIVAGGGFTVFSDINQSCFSPEAVARREEEHRINQEANRQKQEQEKQDKIKAENAHTLGLGPSVISYKGFRIRYNPLDKNIRYVDVGGKLSYFTIGKGNFLKWKEKKGEKEETTVETGIVIDTYTRIQDSKKVPKLEVRISDDVRELWHLMNQPVEGIDNSVVVFEDVNNIREYLFIISSPDDFNTYQFRLMRKELVGVVR